MKPRKRHVSGILQLIQTEFKDFIACRCIACHDTPALLVGTTKACLHHLKAGVPAVGMTAMHSCRFKGQTSVDSNCSNVRSLRFVCEPPIERSQSLNSWVRSSRVALSDCRAELYWCSSHPSGPKPPCKAMGKGSTPNLWAQHANWSRSLGRLGCAQCLLGKMKIHVHPSDG